jgi:hypothetical protein
LIVTTAALIAAWTEVVAVQVVKSSQFLHSAKIKLQDFLADEECTEKERKKSGMSLRL